MTNRQGSKSAWGYRPLVRCNVKRQTWANAPRTRISYRIPSGSKLQKRNNVGLDLGDNVKVDVEGLRQFVCGRVRDHIQIGVLGPVHSGSRCTFRASLEALYSGGTCRPMPVRVIPQPRTYTYDRCASMWHANVDPQQTHNWAPVALHSGPQPISLGGIRCSRTRGGWALFWIPHCAPRAPMSTESAQQRPRGTVKRGRRMRPPHMSQNGPAALKRVATVPPQVHLLWHRARCSLEYGPPTTAAKCPKGTGTDNVTRTSEGGGRTK